jgi:hypothetical protein
MASATATKGRNVATSIAHEQASRLLCHERETSWPVPEMHFPVRADVTATC